MTERPILMSAPMVRAILDGKKTMTRRIVKPQPRDHDHLAYSEADWKNEKPEYITTESINAWFCKYCGEGISMMDGKPMYKCPYGNPGDILWVKETYGISGNRLFYRADNTDLENAGLQGLYDFKWKPSIFMPKVAIRIRLEVTGVMAERLNEITEDDAKSEGIIDVEFYPDKGFPLSIGHMFGKDDGKSMLYPTRVSAYMSLWESINGKGSFDLNPWVWVVTFKRVE